MSRPLLALTSLLFACGPGTIDTETTATAATSDTATSNTATSDTATSDTPTSAPSTGTSTATTEAITTSTASTVDPSASSTTTTAGDTTTAGTTGTTTAGTTGTTTADTAGTTTADTTGGDNIEYAAYFWAGGLDHILIHRADFTHNRCATLHLAWPGGVNPAFMISAPDEWAPVNAAIADSTDGCLAGMPMGASVAASSGVGAVTWPPDPNQYCPPLIDLDLTLDFPPDQPWVPAQESMSVTALPVQGCP